MKIKSLLIISVIAILCTGCGNSSVNKDLRSAGFEFSKKFKCDEVELAKDSIKLLGEDYLITNNDDVYLYSLSKMYSNDKRCMKLGNVKGVAYLDNNIIKSVDERYYDISNGLSEIVGSDKNYSVYDFFLNSPEVVKVQTELSKNEAYVLKKDGNIYKYELDKKNETLSLTKSGILYNMNKFDGKIVDFNLSGDKSNTTFIKTDKSYYRNIVTNKDECDKYADVSCIYSFDKDENMSKHYDNIVYYNGKILFTDYNKVFKSVSNGK